MGRMFAKIRNNKGVALITTFLVITVLLIYSVALFNVSINQNITADIFKRRARAFNLAEAGLDHAIFWLRAQTTSPYVGNKTISDGNIGGGSYTVTIIDLGEVGGVGSGIHRYKITSTGSFGNMSRVLTNYLQVDNYARYIWFTDNETFNGTTVWFWTQDYLNGQTHTNAHFNIFGNPVFAGEVRSVDDYIRFYNNGHNINLSQLTNPPYDNPNFQQGFVFGAEPTTMPSQALNLRSAASSGGLWLQGNTAVVLNSNGTMNVTNSNYCNPPSKCNNMALPANGALFVACGGSRCRDGGSLTIDGTFNGRLTVGAQRDIIIPNNIVYADNPRTNPNSDDVLGIIAERDVVISHNAPTNLEIDGSVMALDTSFMLEDWDVGPPKGALTIYGGIIQEERGPVGTFNGSTGQKVSGYSKNYSYDSRLLSTPPPFMPTTGDYITLSWEEN